MLLVGGVFGGNAAIITWLSFGSRFLTRIQRLLGSTVRRPM